MEVLHHLCLVVMLGKEDELGLLLNLNFDSHWEFRLWMIWLSTEYFILLESVHSQTVGITWVFINSKSVRSLFFIFFFWIVFIVPWLELVVWSRKINLIPVEIASFWFLASFKGRGRRVSPRFNLFVSNIIQRNKERGWV